MEHETPSIHPYSCPTIGTTEPATKAKLWKRKRAERNGKKKKDKRQKSRTWCSSCPEAAKLLLAAGQLVLFRTQIRMGRRKKERKNKNKKVQSRPADFTMADGETTFRQPSWPRLFKANLSGKSLGLFQLTTTKKKESAQSEEAAVGQKGAPPRP